MAVTYVESYAPAAVTLLEAGGTINTTLTIGATVDRLALDVTWVDRSQDITEIRVNSVAMTSVATKESAGEVTPALHSFTLDNPTTGTDVAVAIDYGASSAGNSLALWGGGGYAGTGISVSGPQAATGNGTAANIVSDPGTVTSATNARVHTAHATYNETAIIDGTATGFTERQDGDNAAGLSLLTGDADGAATVDPTVEWSNGAYAVSWVAGAYSMAEGGGGGGLSIPIAMHYLNKQRSS